MWKKLMGMVQNREQISWVARPDQWEARLLPGKHVLEIWFVMGVIYEAVRVNSVYFWLIRLGRSRRFGFIEPLVSEVHRKYLRFL